MADDISRENHDRIEVEAEKQRTENVEHVASPQDGVAQMDPARRIVVEKALKRKLDARCSLFVAIYSEYPRFQYRLSHTIGHVTNVRQS
jgi:porphobilinogen deaminase